MFNQDYFSNRKYSSREQLVRLHVLEVIRWASRVSGVNVFDGYGKRALDVGCAYGYTSNVLSKLGYETYGCDISPWAIRQTKSTYGEYFVVCDTQYNLPFRSGSFDLITCFDVLEHLQFPERALQNMLAVGTNLLLCTTPNKNVEKPIKTLLHDVDETHINVKSSAAWEKSINANLSYTTLKIEPFYDIATKLFGTSFFKSIDLPYFGLTLRVLIKK